MKTTGLLGMAIVSLAAVSIKTPPVYQKPSINRLDAGITMCAIGVPKPIKIDSLTTKPPLYEGLGRYHFEVSTKSNEASKYFDQGMVLYYGFNHMEALRSFNEAAKIDPELAMAYWGEALCLGPNINLPMEPSSAAEVYGLLQKAVALSDKCSPREKAYIEALAKRYGPEAAVDRNPFDQAYADGMKKVVTYYPEDLDANALYAESLMDLHPWNYWKKDGMSQPWTAEILSTLERVLAKDSLHIGANHFYIHAVEASAKPERGLPSARRLETLVPAAGHLVHMPSHIYIHTGFYNQGVVSNEKAIKADQPFIKGAAAQTMYALAYHPHNYHFLWATSTLEGRGEYALQTSRELVNKLDPTLIDTYPTMQNLSVTPLYTMVRFGMWDRLLNEPAPSSKLKFPNGIWHYARGTAFIRKGKIIQAEQELKSLQAIAADTAVQHLVIWQQNTAGKLLNIAQGTLEGEIAAYNKKYDQAISLLNKAVKEEDALDYDEPADWPNPVRETLGAILIDAGQFSDAEKTYKEDLKTYPENGWSLYGSYICEQRQGKKTEASKTLMRFSKAFERADVKLSSSRM